MYERKFDLSALSQGFSWFDMTILFVAVIPILLIAILVWESNHE